MKTLFAARSAFSSFLLLVCLGLPVIAQAQDAIGRIIRTSGVVTAVNAAGDSRPLARGSEFFLDEIITTGPDGTVQLRFSDSAMLTLNADSQFSVNEYQFDGEGGAADSVVMSMLRGAMRTISGTIGHGPGDTYQMNTPLANIGIRGTEYGVRVTIGGRTFVVVFDGGISVAPVGGGGSTDLGVGGDSDNAEITDELTIIELDEAPPEAQAIIDSLIEAFNAAELDNLPDPEDAIEMQLQGGDADNNALSDEAIQAILATANQQAGGALVDAQGNALRATRLVEYNEARSRVIRTVSLINPDLFATSTKNSASPD